MQIKSGVAIRPGIDIRAEGGYVVAPPSIVNGQRYEWVDGSAPIADAPDWLIKVACEKKQASTSQANFPGQGGRNNYIMKNAVKQMYKGHPQDVVVHMMRKLNEEKCQPPLDDAEVQKTVEGVFRRYSHQVQPHLTELGRAQKMASLYRGEVRYIVETRKWLQWNGNIWRGVGENVIYALAKEVSKVLHREADELEGDPRHKELTKFALASETRSAMTNMIKLFESEDDIATSISELDQHGFALPVKNGVVDLKTGKFLSADPAMLLTQGTNVEFDANATCPLWEKFLMQVMAGDKEVVRYLQRAIGYSLTTSTQEQCLFFLYGFGANGKSTFLNVLRALMGELGTQSAGETLLENKRNSGAPSSDIARLRGKRFVALSEIDDGKHLAEATMKTLTGGDAVTARHLYSNDFEFTPAFKLWLAANHKPTIKSGGHGTWRRLRLIPFSVRFDKDQQDMQLEKKLLAELPGILNWAIAGCMDWQRNQLPIPLTIARATEEYRAEMDVLGQWLEEFCIVADGYEIRFDDAFEEFAPWAKTNYRHDYSKIRFGKMLTERGFGKKAKPQRYYTGLTLRERLSTDVLKAHDAKAAFQKIIKAVCAIEFSSEEASDVEA